MSRRRDEEIDPEFEDDLLDVGGGRVSEDLAEEGEKKVPRLLRGDFDFERHGGKLRTLMTEAGLRLGSIVEHEGAAHIVYGLDPDNNRLWVAEVVTGRASAIHFMKLGRGFELQGLAKKVLYTPKPGYYPPFIVLRRGHDEKMAKYRDRTGRRLTRIAALLTEDEKYVHELYGEFWSREAAERINTEPETASSHTSSPSQEPKQLSGADLLHAQRGKYRDRSGFCLYCGHNISLARNEECPVCKRRSSGTKPKTRYCVLCGVQLPEIDVNRKRYIRLCDKH